MSGKTIPERELDRTIRFIKRYVAKNGYAPNLREIAGATRVVPATARYRVVRLAEQGRITVEPSIARSIVVQEED